VSPVEARIAVLVAECRRDWDLVKSNLAKAESVDPAGGDPQAALVALSLDRAYQAFEEIMVRIERCLGLPERANVVRLRRVVAASDAWIGAVFGALQAEGG
jgi:hypothetical protein